MNKSIKNLQTLAAAGLIFAVLLISAAPVRAQRSVQTNIFEKIQMLVPEGEKTREINVRVVFGPDSMDILADKDGALLKTLKYSDLRGADYSYTKKPRWKTGLGLGATAIIFPPMLFIAIPLAFTKHRRHWVTVRGEKDYAVLKVSKSVRKIFIPAFETYSKVRIEGLGENK